MKNTGGRHAGSISAAQFLQRFVNDTPWAHLDIAGTGMSSPTGDLNQSWGSGWGVRLLDRLVDFYENYVFESLRCRPQSGRRPSRKLGVAFAPTPRAQARGEA